MRRRAQGRDALGRQGGLMGRDAMTGQSGLTVSDTMMQRGGAGADKRYIYLTWDDAPQRGTMSCAEVFIRHQVKATFFAVGMNIHNTEGREALDTIASAYPQLLLCNHGWSHGFHDHYKTYYSLPDSAIGDLMQNDSCFHFRQKIVRLPGSNSWVSNLENKGPQSTEPVREGLSRMGYRVIGWDVEWGLRDRNDRGRGAGPLDRGAEQLAREVERDLDQGKTNVAHSIVILSHDRFFSGAAAVDSLAQFIAILRQDPRNVFETIDHYPM